MSETATRADIYPNKRSAMRAGEASGATAYTVEPVGVAHPQREWRLVIRAGDFRPSFPTNGTDVPREPL